MPISLDYQLKTSITKLVIYKATNVTAG